eukprot:Seg2428.5 transcript_id=Seg2428.5/GoldUCD/mRNA.D3Y31 product="hypothetical protein" protein_id=Seg2428.5/GoldUCD/D3Y31
MGHSAKYVAYTVFNCDINMILDFALLQRNEVGSSQAMEYAGFQRAMKHLLDSGFEISALVSDRHLSIAKHKREQLPMITHYFDLWHLKKKIQKILSAAAKRKGFEEIEQWIKPCVNHFYWSATTTFDGNGDLIWAKFKSFLSHCVNEHTELDEPLFNRCAHGEIEDHLWLEKGMPELSSLQCTQ